MKKIGLLVAVELDAVLSRFGEALERRELCGFPLYIYERGGLRLYCLRSGAGEIAAAAGTALLLEVCGVELVVNFGVVGGLTEEMSLAKTVLVEGVVHTDFDASAWLGMEVGRYAEFPSRVLPTAPALVEAASARRPELRRVVCASADKFIEGREKKSALHREFGADICDMESAGVVLTCLRAKKPCLLIKTVSDAVSGGAEEFARELDRSAALCLEVAEEVLREL